MSPEMNSRIAFWRQKEAEGTLTIDDMRLAIKELSGDRVSSAIASNTSRTRAVADGTPKPRAAAKPKVAAVVVSSDDLLAELMGDL